MKKTLIRNILLVLSGLALSFALTGPVQHLNIVDTAMGAFLQQPYSMPSTAAVPLYLQFSRIESLWNRHPVIVMNANTTLTNDQSGAFVVFNTAAGTTATLPTPVVQGVQYTFGVAVTNTSLTDDITTGAGTDFLAGGVSLSSTANTGSAMFNCNGTSHTTLQMNGSTKGGVVGSFISIKGLTGGIWQIMGMLPASGTVVTPCSTTT